MDRTDCSNQARPCKSEVRASHVWTRAALALALSFCLTTQSWARQEPAAGATNAPEGPQIALLDGTPIKLRLNRTMSSADATVGQPVDFSVTEDVAVNGTVVIAKGSAGMGKVTEAQPKRRMGRAGKLEIVLTYVRLADLETVPVRAVKESKGKNAAVGMTVGIVAAGVLFFPAAPLFLLMKGKDITVPEGAEVVAYVDGDRKLEAVKFAPKEQSTTTAAAEKPATAPIPPAIAYPAGTAPETTGLVEIQSNPTAASVYVDGTFMANTPSTLHLSPGQHSVRMVLDGYKEWMQDVNLEGGASKHLSAELEKVN